MKRVLAAVLALVMILGSVPLAAFASETGSGTSSTGTALNGPLSLPDASAASSGFAGGDTTQVPAGKPRHRPGEIGRASCRERV